MALFNISDALPLSKFLKKTAVPSIFFFNKNILETPAALKRKQRIERRGQRKAFEETDVQSTSPNNVTTKKFLMESVFILDIGREEICTTVESVVPQQVALVKTECTKSTQVDHEHMYGSINRHKNDDKSILFYTGFETYKKFYFVYSTLSPMTHKIQYHGSNAVTLTKEDQFFMTMMKLRQNKCNFELSKFFNVSTTTVSNIFITWVNFIYQFWSRINICPNKELLQNYLPQYFKAYDKNIKVISNGSEITWNSYNKQASSLKIYKILKSELDHNYIPIASKILFVCLMCCNFRESIIKFM